MILGKLQTIYGNFRVIIITPQREHAYAKLPYSYICVQSLGFSAIYGAGALAIIVGCGKSLQSTCLRTGRFSLQPTDAQLVEECKHKTTPNVNQLHPTLSEFQNKVLKYKATSP